MTRPRKRLTVDPELRKKWLRRHEENGDSAPHIASLEGYDVRTVRKQIELARQERELRETRLVVLRDALQEHYRDLSRLAERLDSAVVRGDPVSSLAEERLYAALRRHLPRSPLWKYLEDWNRNHDNMEQARAGLRTALAAALPRDSRLKESFEGGRLDTAGVMDFFLKQSEFWSRGWPGLDIEEAFKTTATEDSGVNLKLGAYSIGTTTDGKIFEVKEALASLRKRLPHLSSFRRLVDGFREAEKLAPVIREELATIALRRVVPGRCKYCPI
jgi:hypothetical protein